MDNFFQKAFEFVQEDKELLNVSVDIRQMLSPLIKAQKHGAILQILKMVQSKKIENESLFYLESLCLLQENNFKDSEKLVLSALWIDENKNAGKQKENFEELYMEIYRCKQLFDKQDQLWDFLEEKAHSKKEIEFGRADLASNGQELPLRQKAIENQIPSILMLSTARAASSNISNQLCKFSGSFRVDVAAQSTPIEHDVALGLLLDFVRGGAVSYVHSRASEKNLKALLNSNVTKFMLHIRDPRQCFLSNYYRMHASNDWVYKREYYNHLPLEYEQMDFTEQIDWHIDNVYEHYWVNWIKEWLEIAESPSNDFQIKVVTYEKFMQDPLAYFEEIGAFFEQDWSGFSKDDLLIAEPNPKTEVVGRIDFWRQKLTPSQVERLQKLTPESLLKKFKWER
jgi:hypothetical protein